VTTAAADERRAPKLSASIFAQVTSYTSAAAPERNAKA
jgi:hypothetical protein